MTAQTQKVNTPHAEADGTDGMFNYFARNEGFWWPYRVVAQTLLQTQETSGRAIETARKEAQLIIQEAEMKAAHILEKARNDLTAVKEQVVILRTKKDSIVSRMKMLLNSEMEIIKALEVDEEFQRSNPEAQQEFTREKSEIDEIIKSLDRVDSQQMNG